MIETTRKMVPQESPVAWVCDACGMREEGQGKGLGGAQEWLSWRHRGGYDSVFGDGEELSLDLCQDCVEKLLGGFLKRHGNAYGE